MDYDPHEKRWVWLYQKEAKQIASAWAYQNIPKEKHPIVLGSFFSTSENSMYFDTNSLDRAAKAIAFFAKHLSRSIAEVTEIEIVNKLFAPSSERTSKHADFFDRQQAQKLREEDVLAKIEALTASIEDIQERQRVVFEPLESTAKQPLPEIETLPIHFYEDGIGPLETSLKMRTVIAHRHWLGNKEYSMYDLVHEMIPY